MSDSIISESRNHLFFGGTDVEDGYGIFLDNYNNIYITGFTFSHDFDVSNGAFQTTCAGRDVFVTKFKAIYSVGLEENEDAVDLTAFPNPITPEQTNFTIGGIKEGTWQIELIDPLGKQMQTSTKTVVAGVIEVQLENKYPSGVYFVRISNETGTSTLKIIIQSD